MYKKIITLVAAVLAIAALTVPATSVAGHSGPHPLVFCLNGKTVSEGQDVLPFLLFLDPADRALFAPIILDDSLATLFRFFIRRDGGVGRFRLFADERAVTDFNTVTEGACEAAVVSLDRNFWLCYSRFQIDPAVYSRGDAIKLYDNSKGNTVPFAVREPLSKTRLNSGLYLVCNLPAGYTVQSGVAVSTGGGELFGPASLANSLLATMPLDYTRLAVRS